MTLKKFLKENVPEGKFKDALREINAVVSTWKTVPLSLVSSECSFNYGFIERRAELTFCYGKLDGVSMVFPDIKYRFMPSIPKQLNGYFHDSVFVGNPIIVDAGAFPGDFCVAAAKLLPASHIIALEPDPYNHEHLNGVILANDVRSQIDVHSYALSDSLKESDFFCNGEGSKIVPSGNGNGVKVHTITLDALLEKTGVFSSGRRVIVKMDIEGEEINALRGAKETLDRGATFLIAAYHMVDGKKTADTLVPLFKHHGYHVELVNPKHLTLYAHK